MQRHHPFTSIVLAALLMLPLTVTSQENSGTTENVTTINLLNPGVSRELRAGHNQTVRFTAMMNILVRTIFSSDFSATDVYLAPALEAGYRYYFNLAKRTNAGKRIEKNSEIM